ncbi:MAG: EAL domain-containing protein [Chromatiales bacterium]
MAVDFNSDPSCDATVACGNGRDAPGTAAGARIRPATSRPFQRTLARWAGLHALAALAAGALLWRTLPTHLTIPWLVFMLLTSGLYLARAAWRSDAADRSGDDATLLVMAATYGLAWAVGLGLAIPDLSKMQMVMAVLAVTSLAAMTAPLLAISLRASRVYLATLATAPAAIFLVSYSQVASHAATAVAVVCGAMILVTCSLSAAGRYARAGLDADTGLDRTAGDDLSGQIDQLRIQAARHSQALFRSEQERERALSTLQALSEAVVTTDADGHVDYMNPAAEVLTGCSLDAARGQPAATIVSIMEHGAEERPVDPIGQCLLTERTAVGEEDTLLTRRDGSKIAVEYTCSPIHDNARFRGAALMFRDVREKRDMQSRLNWAATHDPLTGLMNRREFEARMRTLRDEAGIDGKTHALCYIDLDHFKTINDTRGHLAGDEFLKGLAETLRGRVRGADALARLGGDEFAALLYGCPLEKAERIAENIRSAIAEYCQAWGDHNVQLGASIGVVEINDRHKDLTELLAAADVACYSAKNEGRNRVHVFRNSDDMMARWHSEVRWLQTLQHALANNGFELHWQPIAAAAGDNPARMCELFMRVRDEHRALHMPAAFATAAQRYHLMPAIDLWVVSAVLEALRAHDPVLGGMDCICINLAGQSVSDERFLSELQTALSDHSLPVGKLCFEISEATLAVSPSRVRHFVATLKHRGCRIAIDNCGAGAGLFAHLRNLGIDFLKIDKDCIRHLDTNSVDYEIVLSLQRIALCMGVKTVAECVENEATLTLLRRLGIDYVQGHAVAVAMRLDLPLEGVKVFTQVA